jgi:hypothetical protein
MILKPKLILPLVTISILLLALSYVTAQKSLYDRIEVIIHYKGLLNSKVPNITLTNNNNNDKAEIVNRIVKSNGGSIKAIFSREKPGNYTPVMVDIFTFEIVETYDTYTLSRESLGSGNSNKVFGESLGSGNSNKVLTGRGRM